jgi:hypothetical protein
MNDKNIDIIPKGIYCYTFVDEEPIIDEDGISHFKINSCPYWGNKDINGVKMPWCHYLNKGGWDNRDYIPEERNKILEYYNNDEKKMDEELCLMLLFDGCKECGINDFDDVDNDINIEK